MPASDEPRSRDRGSFALGCASALTARGLALGYGTGEDARTLLDSVDLALRPGEMVCLLGPNGAGKSTLLRTLAGLQPPRSGSVALDGRPFSDFTPRELARRLAVVLTGGDAPPGLLGGELVRLGRQPHTGWSGRLAPDDARAIAQALAQVDGEALADRPLAAMSDGERQKLSIARALAQNAGVLLLDEPTAFLDLPRRLETLRILRRTAHEEGRAVLLSTHDLDLALRSADRVWLLADGRMTVGLPEELVLSGALGEAFARDGIEFDPREGSFRIERRVRGTVRLEGGDDSLESRWLRRALERLGWRLEQDVAPSLREARAEAPILHREGGEWRLRDPAGRRQATETTRLSEVVAWLEQVGPGGSAKVSSSVETPLPTRHE